MLFQQSVNKAGKSRWMPVYPPDKDAKVKKVEKVQKYRTKRKEKDNQTGGLWGRKKQIMINALRKRAVRST